MKITYKEVKENKNTNKKIYYNVYRNFSTPFTYLFVRLDIPPPLISILNFFPSIAGYFLLSHGSYIFFIFGILFFIMYNILDCCDGEVARIRDPNAMNPLRKKTEGAYFDTLGHFITPIFLGCGIGVGLYKLYGDEIFITLGVILSVLLTLEYAVSEVARSFFRKGVIERKIALKNNLKNVQKILDLQMDNAILWEERSLTSKIIGVYKAQGLAFSKEFMAIVLLFLAILEYNLPMNFSSIFNVSLTPLSLFLAALVLVKLVNISSFVIRLNRHKYITAYLEKIKGR